MHSNSHKNDDCSACLQMDLNITGGTFYQDIAQRIPCTFLQKMHACQGPIIPKIASVSLSECTEAINIKIHWKTNEKNNCFFPTLKQPETTNHNSKELALNQWKVHHINNSSSGYSRGSTETSVVPKK